MLKKALILLAAIAAASVCLILYYSPVQFNFNADKVHIVYGDVYQKDGSHSADLTDRIILDELYGVISSARFQRRLIEPDSYMYVTNHCTFWIPDEKGRDLTVQVMFNSGGIRAYFIGTRDNQSLTAISGHEEMLTFIHRLLSMNEIL